jgi:lauroyl/myristoyl acyltransferase
MQRLIQLLACLRLCVLDALAAVLRFIVFRVLRYRRALIADNLGKCFSDLSVRERAPIA